MTARQSLFRQFLLFPQRLNIAWPSSQAWILSRSLAASLLILFLFRYVLLFAGRLARPPSLKYRSLLAAPH